ncbi:unnamed protein product [Amoebophrya sp. A120]|nr:unnamed protein product [Amoebophrya sp. A120]|eukprot:GSA120T00000284001.1
MLRRRRSAAAQLYCIDTYPNGAVLTVHCSDFFSRRCRASSFRRQLIRIGCGSGPSCFVIRSGS